MLIACATDRNYVEMTGVLIRSICAQTHQTAPEIVVYCFGVGTRDKKRLTACAASGGSVEIVDIEAELHETIRHMPVQKHISVMAYISIFIPKLLQGRAERLLYLDTDIVVNASLDPLFQTDMQGRSVAAAQDTAGDVRLAQFNAAIGHPPEEPYFNSGVFLVDIESWNERHVTERGSAYARERPEPILQHDQAVLNRVLKGDWVEVAQKWNEKPTRTTPQAALTMPVLHFRGRLKPFHADYPKEYRVVYDRYRAETPWARTPRSPALLRSFRKRKQAWSKYLNALLGRERNAL